MMHYFLQSEPFHILFRILQDNDGATAVPVFANICTPPVFDDGAALLLSLLLETAVLLQIYCALTQPIDANRYQIHNEWQIIPVVLWA